MMILAWPLAVSTLQSVLLRMSSAIGPPMSNRVIVRATLCESVLVVPTPTTAPNEFVRARTISTPMRSHGVPSMSTFMACVAPPTTSGCAIRRFASSTGFVKVTV